MNNARCLSDRAFRTQVSLIADFNRAAAPLCIPQCKMVAMLMSMFYCLSEYFHIFSMKPAPAFVFYSTSFSVNKFGKLTLNINHPSDTQIT